VDAGIDTVSYAFRPTTSEPLRAFAALPTRRLSRRERGESRWATHRINGVKVGAFPAHGLLVTEGRLAPVLSGDVDDHSLASAGSLVEGGERVRAALASVGVSITDRPVMRRIDLATDLRFEDAADGAQVLRAFAGVHMPRHRQDRRTTAGTNTGTVSWLADHRIVLRIYDAGEHHGTDAPGVRLRFERQWHPRKAGQQTPESVLARDLGALFLGPFRKLMRATPTVLSLSPRAAELRIIEQAQRDKRFAVAERRIGMVRVFELGQDTALWGSKAADRRREMRDLGIVIDERASATPWDLRPLLDALASPWREMTGHAT
jgi:hypothetical protein